MAAVVAAERPKPGVDLDGPVAPPKKTARTAPAGGATPLDLGKDRPVAKITLPTPPRGAAAAFSFGDDRQGWVARVPETLQLPSPAYGDGRIFVSGGFESTSMYALDAQDGHMLWASQALEDNGPTAPSFQDGHLIFNTESCTLFVMDATTGKKLWFKFLGDPTVSQPSYANGLVFASHPANGGQQISAYKLQNGDEVWSHDIGSELVSAPVVHGDSLYFSTIGGRTYRLLQKGGKEMWSKTLHATSAPWIDGDELYFSRREKDSEVQVVASAETGAILREHRKVEGKWLDDVPADMGDWKKVWAFEGSRPAIVGGVRYEAMGGVLQASDPKTGEAYWTRRFAAGEKARSLGTVAIAGPQVVVATRSGDIYGLDIDTGYTLWAYGLGKKIIAEPVVAKGWVYATTADGEVIALHVGDSSLDGWHMWGGTAQHDG